MTTTNSATIDREPVGAFVESDGRSLYQIEHVDAMDPFLMTLVSDTDLWLFLSSAGAFTAGRVEADRCLFSYETDDRLHELAGLTGPVTSIRFDDGRLWRPLRGPDAESNAVRTLRRSPVGDIVELEETDGPSGLTLRIELSLSDDVGVVRRCELLAPSDGPAIAFELIDGYVNVMPAGVPLSLQQGMSTLVDGYKRAELMGDGGLALYALESTITDKPEAVEALRANVVWRTGLDGAQLSLDPRSLRAFERGDEGTDPEPVVLGRRGAYLCRTSLRLEPAQRERWSVLADAHMDHAAIAQLERLIRTESELDALIERSLVNNRERLASLLDAADGAQVTADVSACATHRSNVLFNAMRGGVPLSVYAVETREFRRFVHARNSAIAARSDAFLAGLPGSMSVDTLRDAVRDAGDAQLERLAYEYLPLTFGRRHGDPSRPWNRFRIQVRDEMGSRVLGYEGNWRDIFQNWEAMCLSYPAMLPGVVAKFVNASTVDGYNPYRVNEHGIDWETPSNEEMSGIGYWGDHQIVYLLRLLERCQDIQPGWLDRVLQKPIFSYANVPYRIKPFDEITRNPRRTMRFDSALDTRLRDLTDDIGGDARFVLGNGDEPMLVTLLEKLLVPALAKASNLVPDGGIWMNTERPEWNDANNALAGNGLSMVTLYQLRRYSVFAADLIGKLDVTQTPLSPAVADWCEAVHRVLVAARRTSQSGGGVDDSERRGIVAALGEAAETARETMYQHGVTPPRQFNLGRVVEFFELTRDLCDEAIRGAKRDDGLYESYNVLHLSASSASIEHLQPMLEGQVAVLSSGALGPEEAADLLDALFASNLYREDQRTFMLYPRVDLPRYMDRNAVPRSEVDGSELLRRAINAPETAIITYDSSGMARFHADLTSHAALGKRLNQLAMREGWDEIVDEGRSEAHDAFERTFKHARFTGRSGRMHKYEGLGSIYWHMVSKLLLATQECFFEASDAGVDPELLERLREHYVAIRDGLGFRKTPAEFGAVPHEPYSHTPWNAGAQQPGMTGQVKEGVIARLGELGVRIHNGAIRFDASLLDPAELLSENDTFLVRGISDRTIEVPAGAVGLTLCGTPIVIRIGQQDRIALTDERGARTEVDGAELSRDTSRAVFARDGKIVSIDVELAAHPTDATGK